MASIDEWCPDLPDTADLMASLGGRIAEQMELECETSALPDSVRKSAVSIELENYADHRRRPRK